MGSALALAAVTALLKHLLENGLAAAGVSSQVGGDAIVSALAPDRIASGEDERPQLNLFLYLVTPRAGLSSNGAGREGRGGALTLDLHYLLTAYGAQDLQAEILLGYTFQVLNDSPVLERERIRTVLKSLAQARERRVVSAPLAALAAPEVADGFDRLVIEPEFMDAEAVSKLWSALQARYRPSATYKVSAALIPGAARTRPVARATPQPSLR
jgi:hypothetical protein